MEPGPVGLAPQELEILQSKSTGPIQEADCIDKQLLPPIVPEPLVSRSEPLLDMGDSIVERPSKEEELPPGSFEERDADIEIAITPSAGSPVLSSPMPWEQIENSTIRIEEVASPSTPLVESEGASLLGGESVVTPSAMPQDEFVSDELSSPVPAPDLAQPRESIFSMEPSTSPPVHSETEASTPSVAPQSSSTVPFSWNTVFDGAWKFASGTLSSSSSDACSNPYAVSRDVEDLETVQSESTPDPGLASPAITSTQDPLAPLSGSEPLPSAHPSILSEEKGSSADTTATSEPSLLRPQPVLLSEALSQPESLPTFSCASLRSSAVDLPVPFPSDSVEPASEFEPASFPSFAEPQATVPESEACAQEPLPSAAIQEVPPALEPVSTGERGIPLTPLPAMAPPSLATPSDVASATPASMDTLSSWSTGEVEVQPHRPSEKKRNWDKEKREASLDSPAPLPRLEESSTAVAELSRSGGWELPPSEGSNPIVETVASVVEEEVVRQEDSRPEWVRASESITFVDTPSLSSARLQDSGGESTHSNPEPAPSVAVSAVNALFHSTGEKSQVSTRDRLASPSPRPWFSTRVARVRIGISSFIGSCFSTTRSMVLLCVGVGLFGVVLVAVVIGAIGVAWMVMETPPSPVYQKLTESPPRVLVDSTKNGYFLLLGFDAFEGQDPLQVGYDRKLEGNELQAAHACMLGDEGKGTIGASAKAIQGSFTSADPVAQLKPQVASVRSWVAQESLALKRYEQWLSMSFEDAGYGQVLSPNCAHILLAHRLYLAEGFAQDLNTGLGRLEIDMRSWRTVLGQSKTLMVKMLAATAVQDNVTIASGLLTRQDLDETAVGRLSKIVRPLDQVELSLRWPMQSHLAWATKAVTKNLKNDETDERPLYVALAAKMPLPVQRRSNAYADYYEAASKAVAEGRYTNLPKPSSFLRTPPATVVDYVANPIEHIIGIEPLPSWDPYVGRIVETDARLRLASLQVWVRQGAQDGNVVTRLAKASQDRYDPFTGLPMLVNQQRGVMYSVGQDGKDQDGDSLRDVVAIIPKTQSVVIESSRSVPTPRSK